MIHTVGFDDSAFDVRCWAFDVSPRGEGCFWPGRPGTIWDYTGFQPLTTRTLASLLVAGYWMLEVKPSVFALAARAQKNFYFFRAFIRDKPRQAATTCHKP